MQEFECCKVALSFASEYLDAMPSSSMKEGTSNRTEFPEKDPEGWKPFHEFSTLQMIGKLRYHAEIKSGNASKLLPCFHEFHMNNHGNGAWESF